jgi:hypothetical protein
MPGCETGRGEGGGRVPFRDHHGLAVRHLSLRLHCQEVGAVVRGWGRAAGNNQHQLFG